MNLVIEQLTAKLSSLYKQYGYAPYTMSKFEEYGLYLRNKDFLISDRVLTFTDTDGKLMALKPDVTLSIIKNTADHLVGIRKVYYRENVYRPGNAMQGFREILQVGLECMGNIDDYCILETLRLAVKSLLAISDRCVLDISHMGLVTNLLDRAGLTGKVRQQVLDAIGSKNTHELQKICEACDAPWEELVQIAKLSGKPQEVLPQLEEIMGQIPEILQFKKLLAALDATGCSDYINVDFSVVNDMRYYNGIVFRGFVEGIPGGVLSGGQYDGLMEKMHRKDKAIGFAIYPDLLERLEADAKDPELTTLLYEPDVDLAVLAAQVEALAQRGVLVSAQPVGTKVKGNVLKLEGIEVKPVYADA